MTKERIIYFDILNIVSCISVIWLHCNSILYRYDQSDYWYLSLFVQVAAHFAVPCFLMISGANLMNYRQKYTTRAFAIKRVTRSVIPLLIWSGVSLVYRTWRRDIYPDSISDVIELFLNHEIDNIYWFFFPLFGVYMCLPVLSLIAKRKYLKHFLYMALMGIFFYSFMPFVMDRFFDMRYSDHVIFPMAAGYLPYALLGYYLANKKLSLPAKIGIYSIGILSALIMYYGTIWLTEWGGAFNNALTDYQSFASYGIAVAVFVLFKDIGFQFLNRPKLAQLISVISGASLGIYLIHMLVMDSLLDLTGISVYGYGWQLLGEIPVYLIALILVLLFKKIPFVGKFIFP